MDAWIRSPIRLRCLYLSPVQTDIGQEYSSAKYRHLGPVQILSIWLGQIHGPILADKPDLVSSQASSGGHYLAIMAVIDQLSRGPIDAKVMGMINYCCKTKSQLTL